jgi:hypothetical protein
MVVRPSRDFSPIYPKVERRHLRFKAEDEMSKGFFSPIAVAALALSTAPTGAATIPITNTVVLPGITGGVYAEAGITFGEGESATLNAPPSMFPLKATAQNLDAGAQAAATGGSDPAIAISVSAGGDVVGSQAHADASLNYSLEVVGPSGAPVPVDLKSSITGTLISGSAYGVVALASASLVVVNPSGALVSGSYLPAPPQPTTVDSVIYLFPNTIYGVSLNALAYALCGSLDEYGTATCDGNLASASAAVDPTFTIDPGFADASQYQIVFSPGVSSAVPETGTWAMMLIGFAGLGYAAFRQGRNKRSFGRNLAT